MGLTTKDIEAAVKKGIERGIDSKLGDMFVDRKQHFLDHQYIEQMKNAGHSDDHAFTKSARKNVTTVKKGGLMAVGASIAGGMVAAVVHWWGKGG